MAKEAPRLTHIEESHSWWNGKAWGLCGVEYQSGTWSQTGWFETIIKCPRCEFIDAQKAAKKAQEKADKKARKGK